jgi:putative chitinase
MKTDALKGNVPVIVIPQLPDVMEKFNINTPLRMAHFLGQCAHESWGFTAVRENLNYSAAALHKTFKKYFPTLQSAEVYARQPEKIANFVYANRIGNGPVESGDGWRFRGRGYIQLTGRANYREFDRFVADDITANPDLVASKYPLLSAAWFWDTRKLNVLADKGITDVEITAVTKKVNGGVNGLADRIKYTNKYYNLLT